MTTAFGLSTTENHKLRNILSFFSKTFKASKNSVLDGNSNNMAHSFLDDDISIESLTLTFGNMMDNQSKGCILLRNA